MHRWLTGPQALAPLPGPGQNRGPMTAAAPEGPPPVPLILASRSAGRAEVLRRARIPFEVVAGSVDEAAVKAAMQAEGAPPRDIADALAELKAQRIAARMPDRLVLGADQVLVCNGRIFDKPMDIEAARAQLTALRGQRHELLSAAVVFEAGRPVWRHIGRAQLTMRAFSDAFLDEYLAAEGDGVLTHRRRLPPRGPRRPALRPRRRRHLHHHRPAAPAAPRFSPHPRHGDAMTAAPPLAGVIGWPVAHSRSPRLHGHWLARYGIDGYYIPIALPPERFAEGLRALPGLGFRGVNVTIPNKEAALALADTVSPRAEAIGAANTFTFADGGIHADNTDGYGFIANLRQHAPAWSAAAGPALVLGAGGSARAIVQSLLAEGAPEIRLANRTRTRAEALAGYFGPRIRVIPWEEAAAAATDAATVVNTTSLGMAGNTDLPLTLDTVRDALVTDLVYGPEPTPFIAAARARGLVAVEGLGMLLHQAVPGFERWFGTTPEVDDALRAAVLAP